MTAQEKRGTCQVCKATGPVVPPSYDPVVGFKSVVDLCSTCYQRLAYAQGTRGVTRN